MLSYFMFPLFTIIAIVHFSEGERIRPLAYTFGAIVNLAIICNWI